MKNISIEKNEKDDMNKQSIWRFVMVGITVIMFLIPVVISIFDYRDPGLKLGVIQKIIIQHESLVSDLFAQQMTISTIFIAVMSLAVNSINDRFVGTSTKYILFKSLIFKPNYITIIVILLALNVSSFVAYLLQSRWGIVISFVLSLIWSFLLLRLTYYLLSKKSKIYFKILKCLKRDMGLYNVIIKKLRSFVNEERDTQSCNHDSYFVEEMLILYRMNKIAEKKKNDDDRNTINEAVRIYINQDKRDLQTLKSLFKEFKGNDCEDTIKWMEEISGAMIV